MDHQQHYFTNIPVTTKEKMNKLEIEFITERFVNSEPEMQKQIVVSLVEQLAKLEKHVDDVELAAMQANQQLAAQQLEFSAATQQIAELKHLHQNQMANEQQRSGWSCLSGVDYSRCRNRHLYAALIERGIVEQLAAAEITIKALTTKTLECETLQKAYKTLGEFYKAEKQRTEQLETKIRELTTKPILYSRDCE